MRRETSTDSALDGRESQLAHPYRWSAIAYVAVLWLPLFAITVASKCLKMPQLGRVSATDVVAVLTQDLLVLLGLGTLFALGLGARAGWVRACTRLVFHLVMPVATGLMVAEHSFFVVTGVLPDWLILKDGLVRFSSLFNLYLSEVTPLRATGLLTPVILSAALYPAARLLRWRRVKRDLPLFWVAPWVDKALRAVLIAAVATACLGWLLSPSLPLRPLRRNVLSALTYDLARDLSGQTEDRGTQEEARQMLGQMGPRRLEDTGQGPARNVVLIALESTGAIYTSLYSDEYDTTPFLKQLRKRGALVERGYTVVPHTSKALVSMHCGVYPKLSPTVVEAGTRGIPTRCMANLLRDHGFATGFIQPAEESYERRADLVREMGFDDFQGKESLPPENFDESNYFGWEDDAMVKPALKWVDAQKGKRFFLGMLTLTAHHPYAIPRGYPEKRYASKRDLNEYLNTVSYTDRFLKKLFAGFEQRGLLDNTVFVIVGDHGEGFGQHRRRQHDGVIYEEGLRIPMLLVGAGVKPGSSIKGLRQLIDVAPTITRLLGFEGDQAFQGHDMLTEQGHRELFAHCFYNEYCSAFIREDRKVIHHWGRRADELFDLRKDPKEKRNLLRKLSPAEKARFDGDVLRLKRMESLTNAVYDWQAQGRLPAFVTPSRPKDVGTPLDVQLGDVARLIGAKVEPSEIEAGSRAVVTQYYEVLRRPDARTQAFMHLRGPQHRNEDHVPVEGAYPPTRWKAGDFIEDRHVVGTRPDTPTGTYTIYSGLFSGAKKRRLPIVSELPVREDSVVIGKLTVSTPRVDPAEYILDGVPDDAPFDIRLGDKLRLVGAQIDKGKSKGGLKMTVEQLFEVLAPLGDHLELRAEVTGSTRFQWIHKPVRASLPLSKFPVGKVVRDPMVIITHTRHRIGAYQVWLSLYDTRAKKRLPIRGKGLEIEDDRVQVARYRLTR